MKEDVDSLLETIREACTPKAWSAGVLLARAGEMVAERREADEVRITIRSSGGMISPVVSLWPSEDDWSCDCASREDACAHAAAAAISLRDALASGKSLPEPKVKKQNTIGYRFKRTPTGLDFRRVLVDASGAESPLTGTLAGLARLSGLAIVANRADATVETVLGTRREGVLPGAVLARVLAALGPHADARLDNTPVTGSTAPLLPVARLTDAPGGFTLKLEPHPNLQEIFSNGLALVAGELRPLGETGLDARSLDELPRGKFYRWDEAARLASEVLPSLKAKGIELDVRTRRLPDDRQEPPRARVYAERDGDALSVLPTVVYGQPPIARVDQGQLILLGEAAVPVRDRDAELRVVRALHRDLGLEPGRRYTLQGAAALSFAERLRNWGGHVEGAGLGQFYRAGGLLARVEVGHDIDIWFEEGFKEGGEDLGEGGGHSSAGEGRRASAAAVLAAWRAGSGFVGLEGGGFSPLPAGWLAQHGARLEGLLLAREAAGKDAPLPPALAPEVGALCDALEVLPPPSVQAVRKALESPQVDWRLPADFRAELRAYQQEGVRWLNLLRAAGLGALLADDMGLGKTVQVLAMAPLGTLVVAPTSVLFNWAQEAARFRPQAKVCVFHGPNRKLDEGADITLTTYGVLRQDPAALAHREWSMAVLDEAHAIKNPQSQAAKAAHGLRARFRVTLTGTPVENRLEELWSLFHFINPGMLGRLRDFSERVAAPILSGEPEAAQRLRDRIRPYILRRLKREVATELPPRTEMVLRCELSRDERAVYDAVLAATRRDLVERLQGSGNVMAMLEALLRLRQAACHPSLVPGQSATGSSKLELLYEVLEEATSEGHKALVFSQWTSLLDLVEPGLETLGLPFTRLDGSTPDREKVVNEFQSPTGPPVMLLSLKAGGVGLNLTAADLVILLDPWWNPAAEDQAADRAHRIGQDKPVLVYRLVASDTVEERILSLQDKKRALADAAVGLGAHAAAITRDELLDLLN